MLGVFQIVGALLAFGIVLTLTSETFASPVSRVVEAAFDSIEYRLALRARSRAQKLKARRRADRRRDSRVREAAYSHG
jgi:uncharacterized membrane protein